MARLVDESKLSRIHAATLELVVENGYGGASTAAIARKAGVAEGYLYRFYSSKQELVTSLLYSKINHLIVKLKEYLVLYPDIKKVIELLIHELFILAETVQDEIRFIHVLMHDYNFQISQSQREEIKILCEKVIEIGINNEELNPNLTIDEVYSMGIVYPIEFINLRIKGFFGNDGWSENDKRKVVEFCLNSLK
jgi:AcrR family transcriptional regulator